MDDKPFGALVKNLGRSTSWKRKSILFSKWADVPWCFEAPLSLRWSVSLPHVLAKQNLAGWPSWAITSNWDCMGMTGPTQTILHWAAFHGSKEAVDVICQHESARAVSARYFALAHDRPYWATWKVTSVDRSNSNGDVPLEHAAHRGSDGIVATLPPYHRALKGRLWTELPIGSAFKDSVRIAGAEVILAEDCGGYCLNPIQYAFSGDIGASPP
ncbi:hypothetical protein BDW66DRAFT_155482 [Aspergillus desertorum]